MYHEVVVVLPPKLLLPCDTGKIAEIRRSPVEVGSLSHYLRRVLYIPGGCLGFLPSTVLGERFGSPWMMYFPSK